MKLQIGTKAMLLATAVVAIACGGILAAERILGGGVSGPTSLARLIMVFGVSSPVWLPVAFTAFAIGRKKLTVAMVLIFAIGEALSVGIVYSVLTWIFRD
jgi:hypothetical protein